MDGISAGVAAVAFDVPIYWHLSRLGAFRAAASLPFLGVVGKDSFLEEHVKNLPPPDFLEAWLQHAKAAKGSMCLKSGPSLLPGPHGAPSR